MIATNTDKKNLTHLLSLSGQGMVCLFGGGGKTSLMFTLASMLVNQGKTVLTTTTTNIFYPHTEQSLKTLICDSAEDLINTSGPMLRTYPHICAGLSHDPDTGKLRGFPGQMLDTFQQARLFDWILVEADGAKRKPIKASAVHEPVFPNECTHLVLVTGLDAMDAPLDETCVHRADLFARNTGHLPGTPLTATAIAQALIVEMNKARRLCQADAAVIFLNKADTKKECDAAKEIASYLHQNISLNCVIAASLEPEPVIKHHFPMTKTKQGV